MSADLQPKKPRVQSDEAKALLIGAVVSLTESVPFPELTARRIAGEAGLDANAIFRHFGSLEGLFIAALREFEARVLAYLSSKEQPGFSIIRDAELWMRFISWLSLSGLSPEQLAADPSLIAAVRAVTLESLQVDPALSERMKTAMFVVAISFIQAQAMLTPTQPDFYTSAVMEDSTVLMGKLIEHLGGFAQELGWN
jgi:AcrR family transcriptional regulator